MTDGWGARVHAFGLTGAAAELAAHRFAEIHAIFASRIGDPLAARAWWVPGRIEVLGKHTDYAGGRSLLCAVERGFHVVASPRTDALVRILDASSGASLTIPLATNVPARPGHWSDYPLTVVRRLARDFPNARTGADLVLRSSLPSASGLSSSSALVIACYLPLAAFNALHSTSSDELGGYLGAVENGRSFGAFAADRGVGTHGGSEDQTAILSCRPGELAQYHFIPVTPEASVPLPAGWVFAIGTSGVHAAKAGGAQARYNDLARETATLLELWNAATQRQDASLLAAATSAPDASARLAEAVRDHGRTPELLLDRFLQFRTESEELIPAVVALLKAGDVTAIGRLVDRSQALAESTLRNQVPETIHLARSARALGAAAASAFGAGFGGSVWALVRETDSTPFLAAWREEYGRMFPRSGSHSEFFFSRPGPPAGELPGPVP